jgi:hypothetical protein
MVPQILIDIVETLKAEKIKIAEKVEGEGRVASLSDEGTIIRFLQAHPILGKYISSGETRALADMLVEDYNEVTIHPVNIKTSIGSSDNATSKGGILYALTNLRLDQIPFAMGWNKFYNLLDSHQADIEGKDYWFLSVDKNDSSNVMIRGAKQISKYVENANPANLLQINWKKEKLTEPVIRTYEESHDTLVNGILRCYIKAINNLPPAWRKAIVASININ